MAIPPIDEKGREEKNKTQLENKIKELEEKLARLDKVLTDESKIKFPPKDRVYKVQGYQEIGTNPVADDPVEIVREVVKAKKTSEPKAGLVPNTESGSVIEDENAEVTRVFPKESIHHFDNLIQEIH